MADLNGRNFARTQSVKERKIDPGELGGEMQSLTEDLQLAATMNIADRILGPKLPEGALVHDAWVQSDGALDAGARLDLGHEASEDPSGSVISADPNAFINQADLTAGAGRVKSDGSEAGMQQLKLGKETQVVATLSGANVTVNPKLSFVVLYTLP